MRTDKAEKIKCAGSLLATSLVGLLLLAGCKKQSQNTTTTPGGQESSAAAPAPAAPPPGQAMTGTPPSSSQAAPAPPSASQAMMAAPPPAPGTPPPPPPPQVYTVARGTRLAVRISQTITEKGSNVGDKFRGSLAQSVRVGGVHVLRAGTPVSGTVVAVRRQGRFKGAGELALALDSVGSYAVTTTLYEKTVAGKGKRSAGLIGGGGGGGALIGALAGGGKGALIGGLVGAGAGTAGAAYTGNANVRIPAESVISFSLTSPITVTLKPKGDNQPQQ